MQVQEVVEYMLDKIKSRKEIFDVAINRGQDDGMKIEKWILIEMLARLVELKDERKPEIEGKFEVEGEHKFKNKRTSRYEHCDLWWTENDQEHWLEVKTIVYGDSRQRGKYADIRLDLEKGQRIDKCHMFYHLTFVFPVNPGFDDIKLHKAYEGCELIKSWLYDIGSGRSMNIVLYKMLNRNETPE